MKKAPESKTKAPPKLKLDERTRLRLERLRRDRAVHEAHIAVIDERIASIEAGS
jgi:hypothetical protein